MKLFVTTTSPFVRKVLVVAHELGLASQIEHIVLRPNPLSASPELSAQNPLNKIPCLVLDDGTALYDSPVICEYLDSLRDGPRLTPQSGKDRWEVLRLQALADGIIDAGILIFYERGTRPQVHQWQAWIDGQVQKVTQALDVLEADTRLLSTIDRPDLGAISAAVGLGWLEFRNVIPVFVGRPSLEAWFRQFSQRPSMIATAPKA